MEEITRLHRIKEDIFIIKEMHSLQIQISSNGPRRDFLEKWIKQKEKENGEQLNGQEFYYWTIIK